MMTCCNVKTGDDRGTNKAISNHKRCGRIRARNASVASEQATTTKQMINLEPVCFTRKAVTDRYLQSSSHLS
uniref:Uncharacterized protein n=1 Tax=Rhizophora mucronata TaxID=61149 RepID=A0A2P2JEE5_RHIMU